jgi:hypothetical protein
MSHNSRQFRFVRDILYSLKQDYGMRADLYHILSVIQDPKTGRKTINKTKYVIKKAILLPTLLKRQLSVELGFKPSGQGNAPPGYDIKERLIIIDNKDLPKDFEIGTSDYLVIDHERHDIKSIDSLEHNQASLLTTKIIEAGEANEIFNVQINDKIVFSETVVTI